MRTLIYLLTLVMGMFSANLVDAQPFFIDEEYQYVTITDSAEAKMTHLGFQKEYLQNDDGSWSKVIMVETGRITPPANVSFTKEEVEKLDEGEEVVRSEPLRVFFFQWNIMPPFIKGFELKSTTGYALNGKSFLVKKHPDTVSPKDFPFWMIPLTLIVVTMITFRRLSFRELSWCFAMITLAYLAGCILPNVYIVPLGIVCGVLMGAELSKSKSVVFTLTSVLSAAVVLISHVTKGGQVGAGIILALFLATLLVIKWKQERKLT